jgi:uncharacterized protein (DUF488 family)
MAVNDSDTKSALFTIGHSNHSQEALLAVLKQHEIDVLVDVRSSPYSRYSPHFNLEALKAAVNAEGIEYWFLGQELGGRPAGERFYDQDGRVLYGVLAQSPLFQDGVRRLEEGTSRRRIAIMCSEEHPAHCHRHLLIGRVLAKRGIQLRHIRGDGTVQTDEEINRRESQPMLFKEMQDDPLWVVS